MTKRTIAVVALLIIGIVPLSVFLYSNSTKKQVPTADKEEVPEAATRSGSTHSSASSELRQMQNTIEKIKKYPSPPEMQIDVNSSYTAVIQTTKGTMDVILDAKTAPITVNNFVFLARQGFYDQTVFHRVISGFMIQGGDPDGNGSGGPGYVFNDEPITGVYTRGTIAMANRGPNTNGSQFFIMHKDYQLPKNYVIFGHIDPKDTESLKTLDRIAESAVTRSESGELSKPTDITTVESVIIKEL